MDLTGNLTHTVGDKVVFSGDQSAMHTQPQNMSQNEPMRQKEGKWSLIWITSELYLLTL